MALPPGVRIAHYEILDSLGAGGMGEVYRARDTKLSRVVALKILPEGVQADPERRARFGREARTLASVNHPHIAQIHGFEETADISALVMELVDGEDLSQRIKRGPIPFKDAHTIARQIGQALEAAHEQGIVHRDLKPGNIKLREDGTVKVLDFGLAKAFDTSTGREGAVGELANSPTITSPATMGGVILGTAAYMAPEQAKGRFVDKRADIWAFGCVFYEMLMGRKAFEGEDVSDTLASVLKGDINWNGVPPQALRLLKRCLERDPKRRLHDIADAWDLIDGEAVASTPVTPARQLLPWIVAALFLLSTIGLLVWRANEPQPSPSTVKFQIDHPPRHVLEIYQAISPDGKRLAFTASGADNTPPTLWVRDFDSLVARELPGTENAWSPFWSPDGKFLAFSVDRVLKKVEANGGVPITIADTQAVVGLGTWSADGTILFGTRGVGPIRRVSSAGGTVVDASALDASRSETIHSFPLFLPDGHRFLYWRSAGKAEYQGVYLGSIDTPADQQDRTLLAAATLGPIALLNAPSGTHIAFVRNGTLMSQPFDVTRGVTIGEAVPIAEHVGSSGSYAFFSGIGDTLTYRTGTQLEFAKEQLTWVSRSGQRIGTVGEPLQLSRTPDSVTISPDGKQAAVLLITNLPTPDVWTVEFARGIATRITFTDTSETSPVWSPDGKRLSFRAVNGGAADIYSKDLSGTANESAMAKSPMRGQPSSWSADGRFLFFSRGGGANQDADIFAFDTQSKTEAPVLKTPSQETVGRISPDGKTLAYQSNESGAVEIYLRAFSVSGDTPSVGPKWRVSTNGGTNPRWRADGKELFFRGPGGSFMAADVTSTANALQTGLPRQLFGQTADVAAWDVSADGQRFLLSIPVGGRAGSPDQGDPITVVLNWRPPSSK